MNKQEIEQYLNNLPLYTNYSKILTTKERVYIITPSELIQDLSYYNIRETNFIYFLTEKDINYPQNIDPKRIFIYCGLEGDKTKYFEIIQQILFQIFNKKIDLDTNVSGLSPFQKSFSMNTMLDSLERIEKCINYCSCDKMQFFLLKLLKSIHFGNTGFLIHSIQPNQEKNIKNFDLIKTGNTVVFGGINTTYELYTILNKIGEDGFLYAFEPSKMGFENLKTLKTLQKNFKIEKKILGKKNNNFINFFDNNTYSTTIIDNTTDQTKVQKLQTTTIDQSLNGKRVDIIWLSVNGDEISCLYGAKSSIKKFKPRIIIKLHPKNILDVLELLISLNKNYRFEFGYYDQKNFLDELYLYVESNC